MGRSGVLGREAIVVGGGMGGLVAARVLADHFERVTVLERDALDNASVSRPGVPQGKHLHALLAGGQRALDELFPGFTGDLDRAARFASRWGSTCGSSAQASIPFPTGTSASFRQG